MNRYNFDKVVCRKGTYSAKWRVDHSDVIPLSVADMDIPAPPQLIARLSELNEKGIYGYTDLSTDWNQTITNWLARHYQWLIDPDWVVFCPRVIQAIAIYLQNFTQRNDNVVMFSPSYCPISNIVKDNGRKLVECQLVYENNHYQVDFADLEQKLATACCFILLSPHNPTGTVWEKSTLLKIIALCEKYQVFIISDDVHADFCFEQHTYYPLAALHKYALNHGIICSSPSKTFNLPGLEIANLIIANPKIRATFKQCLHAAGFHNPGYFSVAALEVAYRDCDDWLRELKDYLLVNKIYAGHFLTCNIPGMVVCESAGTYLLWVNYQSTGLTEQQLKIEVLERAGVDVSLGSGFGDAGVGFFRLNVALPRRQLEIALDKIVNSYNSL